MDKMINDSAFNLEEDTDLNAPLLHVSDLKEIMGGEDWKLEWEGLVVDLAEDSHLEGRSYVDTIDDKNPSNAQHPKSVESCKKPSSNGLPRNTQVLDMKKKKRRRNKPVEAQMPKEKLHLCDICGARYIERCGLHKHKNTKHTDQLFQCKICQKFYARPDTLARHVKDIHLKKKSEKKCCVKKCVY